MTAMMPILRPPFDAAAVLATLEWSGMRGQPLAPIPPIPPIPPDLETVHDRWLTGLRTARVRTAHGWYVAVWLESGIEHEVDAVWSTAPSQAIWLHALAGTLCMQAVALLVPEVVQHGCAPVPRSDPDLPEALRQAGLGLERQYTVVTLASWPAGGGCGVCALATPSGGCARRGMGIVTTSS